MDDVGIFNGHLVYFTAISYILWTLGIFCGHLVCFSRIGILYQGKSGNPGESCCGALRSVFFGRFSITYLVGEALMRFFYAVN
jgi:hypothetical protein